MKKNKRYLKFVIGCLICMTFIFGATITVDQTSSINTIAKGIDTASTGDTVYVKTGTYIEQAAISKQITLLGDGSGSTIITNGSYALKVTTSGVIVKGFTFLSMGDHSVYLSDASTFDISNGVIGGNALKAGLYLNATATTININNCVFRDTNYGFKHSSNSATIIITNCIFYNTQEYAISPSSSSTIYCFSSIFISNDNAWYSNGSLNSYYNNYYNNNNVGITLGTGDIATDPQFTDITAGYTLQSSSPCKDAGNPNPLYNDPDGSVNDIGLYGGEYTWSRGPVISVFSISPSTVNQGTHITIQATGTAN